LRPTLGAAFRLEQKYFGFHNVFNAVVSGNLAAVSDVIREGSGQSSALTDYLDSVENDQPLMVTLDLIIPQIVSFLLALSGNEVAEDIAKNGVREQITFLEYHTRLYRLATGWLGWSPEVAWSATPAEIVEAQKGLMEKLKAIHGGKDDNEETKTTDLRSAKDRLNALGNGTVTNMRDVPV
jgi:hypothetical protein